MSLEIALVPRQISDNNLTFSWGREICERKLFSLRSAARYTSVG